jgi:putative transposase
MAKTYAVELTDEERKQLLAVLKKGKVAARTVRRAHILLQADEGEGDTDIAATVHVGVATVERTRKRFVTEGLAAALTERRRPGGQPKLRGKDEAFLIATACSTPPSGRTRWTLQLLADRLVEVGVIDSISEDTIGRTLKKTRSSRG